ncbi:hypothetical protein NDU88_004868 [Pleurodeles waltl]|uniref:Uncharacterized protein n=1 Tax=Pleurodeles waltl TaxID=8319 RepID=A0AAV7RGU8_PLEWA|nr:hypothetical protein NDU88_004868 [Pleurodeles waltl]
MASKAHKGNSVAYGGGARLTLIYGKRDSDEVWRQRRSKDGAEQGALSVFVYCRDQAFSVSVRRAQSVFVCRRERALSVSVYRRDSRIE